MLIPDEIKVAGHVVKIIKDARFDSDTQLGMSQAVTNIMKLVPVSDSVCQSEVDSVFLHEILHHIFYRWNIQPDQEEEDIVCKLTEGLYQVLKDNKLSFHEEG